MVQDCSLLPTASKALGSPTDSNVSEKSCKQILQPESSLQMTAAPADILAITSREALRGTTQLIRVALTPDLFLR